MKKDTFSYLDENYRYLNNYIRDFNEELFISPHSSIIKGKTFTENLTREACKLVGYGLLNRMTQEERLVQLENEGTLEGEILKSFHTIRMLSNKENYADVEEELEVALNIHKNIYKITAWFVQTYIDSKFETDTYEIPMPLENKAYDINLEIIYKVIKNIKNMENTIAKTQDDDKKNEEAMDVFDINEKEEAENIFEDLMIESIINNESDKKCLIQELSKLKEYSKETSEESGEFTNLEKYMNIESGTKEELESINFSECNILTLKDGKVHSSYIKSLITKITDSSELNIFYNSYKKNCTKCSNCDCCPIKANYELLSNENVQDSIVDLLGKCIIKNNITISTKELINVIYELIVPETYIDVNSPMFKRKISNLNDLNYIKLLMPNMIFNHKKLSFIFQELNTLDPLNVKNQKIDDFIIEFNNSKDVLSYFKKYIDYPKGYLDKIKDIEDKETEYKNIRDELLNLFIRSYYLSGKGDVRK
ncbi:DNA phosphorothioation-dependent restriction protein DptF [Clostridium brassicae]|uniref:DNA phosphorothioation-dependent restriction protein DptF n=1 Tax=Clostridium brassicae TaxID=2999072 RepID=A0ABT4D4T9_9CLOT|nr:DNA phosphorothioation-dependent restriction protein DptF [Clostridium brassicae]MCY6957203.1 DNA phosphorothioation-dependent restriction protein DptF [Clostridium brassicae]